MRIYQIEWALNEQSDHTCMRCCEVYSSKLFICGKHDRYMEEQGQNRQPKLWIPDASKPSIHRPCKASNWLNPSRLKN